jgi:hypothetical protein
VAREASTLSLGERQDLISLLLGDSRFDGDVIADNRGGVICLNDT